MENQNKELNSNIKIGLKGFIAVCSILLGIMILVGILTFFVAPGEYLKDEDGKIINNTFNFLASYDGRLPVWRWFTAPIEALLWGKGNFNIIQVIVVILALGGTFKVLDKTGGLYALVSLIVNKFFNKRYTAIWVITFIMMILSSCFGLQEEMLIMFPLFLSFAEAMNWSKVQAISLVLITTGVGFTVALFNPLTIGMAVANSQSPVNITDGIWYRLILFAVFYVITSLYLVNQAKRDEKRNGNKPIENIISSLSKEEILEYSKKAILIVILFGSALGVIILASVIPFISKLGIGMVLMAVTFIVGAFLIGVEYLNGLKNTFKAFLEGVKDLAPSVVVVLLAFSVKYIAEEGKILETLFYYCHNFLCSQTPYAAAALLYVIILGFEFFIPSASAKAVLLIPLLTLIPIPGLSVNVIILAFLFADGYTNVLFPTCGTLVIGISLAEVSYVEWLKKTGLFQLLLFIISLGFLLLAVYIGL